MILTRIIKARTHLALLLILAPAPAGAAWTIVTHPGLDSNTSTRVALATNKDDYSLEIYRDANDVIRLRFSMDALTRLDDRTCPTFQIDDHPAQNRSINDASCLAQDKWAEYIMGYITDNQVTSTTMHYLMNGNNITYRFILKESGYAETSFSLAGSKRILLDALGKDLVVATEKSAAR